MSFDTCKPRSAEAVRAALEEGRDARWVQLAGLVAPSPDADERWAEVDPRGRIHYVAVIDGEVHDHAPRQFWPDSPAVLVCDEESYLRRWASSYDITDALEGYLAAQLRQSTRTRRMLHPDRHEA